MNQPEIKTVDQININKRSITNNDTEDDLKTKRPKFSDFEYDNLRFYGQPNFWG